jgi:hypothetical protein
MGSLFSDGIRELFSKATSFKISGQFILKYLEVAQVLFSFNL